ncbi:MULTISPECIES: group 1 truncated hemoglobin [Pseudoalteromonas]|jgi:hemoglobin|uniref:Group 1 truncated hemoglobin n=1 Tax=Pseudoalteromonas distincta TaxID=77608 RepID=A0A4P9J3B4_9GAMM|nr:MULTISPECIES: group 1 truncated hemoglobin [Pseudoalteromonas]KAA1157707.1 group 1 truncated hemoglobin [Pseudoalteromonas distincta]KHM47141.1 globin [Pseudoalteromonas elyakovii]KID38340.1 globin [Pseudoalteromonas distincta]MBA6408067.1 group 1 truncated hemoglobin [Pseudoalteromonas sp. 5Ae-yellow]MBB1279814.1 group 1 truncated hemoglobin [Pseudoalteromonas sp. SR41-1]|tara:strand:+ start:7615 stop:8034 length:420 start_codon:yes stop_codon:yes gene_type:complete
MKSVGIFLICLGLLSGCANSTKLSLYQKLDGKAGIGRIVDSFIYQIGNDEQIIHYFEHSNIAHFRQGFINHMCMLVEGPCTYDGDSMVAIHTGMHITEKDFNHVVDLLINAMNEQDVSHSLQNDILSRMAPLRDEIIKM